MMGSLSGSAVANTATTGTFTIPMMRAAGFAPHTAAGLEAAASAGGALVPPVMGAGAYMMLEMVDPPVSYLQIVRAALVPSVLYYLSLFLIVDFRARRNAARAAAAAAGATAVADPEPATAPPPATGMAPAGPPPGALWAWEAVVVVSSLGALFGCMVTIFSDFRSGTLAIGVEQATGALNRRTRLAPRRLVAVLEGSSRAGVALVAAAACVGIVLGVVVLTGVGTRLPALILPLAEQDLLLALVALMVSSLVLGMGLPSAVCYLLLATLVGPVLGRLGVVPLAAHLFIFYFGMMSMVTPPVALAAYAASSIAGSNVLASSAAAFRFALAGFTLPFLFVYRPALLLLAPDGSAAAPWAVVAATLLAALGIAPLAAALGGWLRRPLGPAARALLVVAAVAALVPGKGPVLASEHVSVLNLAGIALFAAVALWPVRGGAAAVKAWGK
jgi:TRAP transporter 4TM/12TM fusion protein